MRDAGGVRMCKERFMRHSLAALFVAAVALGGASCSDGEGRPSGPAPNSQPSWSIYQAQEPEAEPMARSPVPSDAELASLPRDERRTKIVEGFVCNRSIQGQSGFIKYLPGGIGLVGHQEGDVQFRWVIENDQFCVRGHQFQDNCSALPEEDLPNEREWLIGALSKSCI